jgi:hypothetical protein
MTVSLWNRRDVLSATAGLGAMALMGGNAQAGAEGKGKMKTRGVVYDVGLQFSPEAPLSVEPFNIELVKYDLHIIAKDLHATAIRIEGEKIDRLVAASRIAHTEGLRVFFNPWKMGVPVSELSDYYAEAAREAEKLRDEGVDITFVAGCEATIFNKGIFPGATLMDRLNWLVAQSVGENPGAGFAEKWPILNEALAAFATAIRTEFKGAVTYSAGAWESVDWSLFDIVGVDYYRQGESDEQYVAGLDQHRVSNKPLVVMEVGSCAYVGAAARGPGGFMVLEGTNPDGSGNFSGGVVPTRSEKEQADYVKGVLNLLDAGGVDGVFIYVFSFPTLRFGEGAKDLDMVSFSLVKTFPEDDARSKEMPPWAPKEAFRVVADFNQQYAR